MRSACGRDPPRKKTNFLFDINHILSYNKYKLTKEKEMNKIKETFAINVAGKTVLINHDGYKFLCDQEDGIKEVTEAIKFSIEKDENSDGFMPYDNFECSVKWEIV